MLCAVLELPSLIAPIKVAISALLNDKKLLVPATDLVKDFIALNLTL